MSIESEAKISKSLDINIGQLFMSLYSLVKQHVSAPEELKKPDLEFLANLDIETKKIISGNATKYLEVITDIQDSGTDLNNTIQSLWRIANKFQWRFNLDTLTKIKDSDVVEIYLPDNTQLFRSFNYFKKTSYSISELFSYPWFELIDHGPEVIEELGKMHTKIFVENAELSSEFTIPSYIATEKFSVGRYKAKLISRAISPIRGRNSGKNEAALLVWDIKILSKNVSIDNEVIIQPNL